MAESDRTEVESDRTETEPRRDRTETRPYRTMTGPARATAGQTDMTGDTDVAPVDVVSVWPCLATNLLISRDCGSAARYGRACEGRVRVPVPVTNSRDCGSAGMAEYSQTEHVREPSGTDGER